MIDDPAPDVDSAVAVHEFLARLLADREDGDDHPLAHYQALFPGHEERIAREYAALGEPGEEEPVGDTSSTNRSFPNRLGRFRILRELGRGGQGVVYLAEDSELHRQVALKVLAAPIGFSPDALVRFRREAESASRLDHPGICTVYEAGEVEGAPYIAMRYVRGETLREKLAAAQQARHLEGGLRVTAPPDTGPDDAPDAVWTPTGSETRAQLLRVVRLMEDVARALHHAHEHGLVHRDIKPGNVLVTDDGTPVVLDFGLVRDQAADAEGLTASGDLLGTPAYLSPEQLQGQPLALDRRTDVYSLGVTLYECLALRRPFEAPTRDALYRQILTEDPPDVRALNRHVPAELKVVLETALEKDRNRRYQTALDLAEDLRRVRKRQPIHARPPGLGLRMRRWVQRNPAPSVALIVLALGLIVAGVLLQRGNVALERLRAMVLADASVEVQAKNGLLALRLAREAVREDPTPYTISQLHAALATASERACFEGHEDYVHQVAFSPDGDSLLTSSGDGTARLWSLTGEMLAEFAPSRRASFSPGGRRILTDSGTACVWSLDGTRLGELSQGGRGFSAAFSPQGRWIVSTSIDGTARIWHGDGPWDEPVQTFRGHEARVLSGTFSRDEERVVTTSEDGTAMVWEHAGPRWTLVSTLGGPEGHKGPVWGASFSRNGERVLTFASNGGFLMDCRDYTARLWAASGELLEVFEHGDIVFSAEFSPVGSAVLTASNDGTVALWRIDGTGRLMEKIPLFVDRTRAFLAACFSPGGDRILVTGAGGLTLVLDRSGRQVATLRGHSSWVWRGSFSPDGTLAATGGQDRTARLWELSATEPPLMTQGGPIRSMDVSQHGAVAVSPDGKLRRWDAQGVLLWERHHPGPEVTLWDVAFSPAGDRIVTAPRHGRVVVWDLDGQIVDEYPVPEQRLGAFSVAVAPGDGGVLIGSYESAILYGPDKTEVQRYPGTARSVAFNSSGDRILTAEFGGVVRVWSRDGELLEQFDHPHEVHHATISSAGDLVLTGCADNRARLWDLAGGPRDEEGRLEPSRVFEGHEGAVSAVAFSRDGRRLATASSDGTARLWTIGGDLVAVLRGHLAAVGVAAFTPDGKRILTASWDGTVRTWMVDPDDLIDLADQRLAGRTMTDDEATRFADLVGR